MNVKDFLFIKELEVPCCVGTTKEERAIPQIILISLQAYLPLQMAGKSDDLSHSIDYASIVEEIRTHLSKHTYCLVEGIAEYIATQVLKKKKVMSVSVQIEKKVFSESKSVGVSITRNKIR